MTSGNDDRLHMQRPKGATRTALPLTSRRPTRPSEQEFRRAMAQFASGVTVVTTRDVRGKPLGLTVSAFCAVSLRPPLVLVCIDSRSRSHAGFRESRVFGVSVLGTGQEAVARRFATRGAQKLAGQTLVMGRFGVPLLPDAVAQIECRVALRQPAGDHIIYVGQVLALSVASGRPLLYHNAAFGQLASKVTRATGM